MAIGCGCWKALSRRGALPAVLTKPQAGFDSDRPPGAPGRIASAPSKLRSNRCGFDRFTPNFENSSAPYESIELFVGTDCPLGLCFPPGPHLATGYGLGLWHCVR